MNRIISLFTFDKIPCDEVSIDFNKPKSNDVYAEKRKAALKLLGDRHLLKGGIWSRNPIVLK